MIILDTNILISLQKWDKNAIKIEEFLTSMKLPIGIPAPVIAEFCAKDHSIRRNYLTDHNKMPQVLSFDGLCAITCGDITEQVNQKVISGEAVFECDRQKLKVDLQIVAIAIVKRAKIILSDDIDIAKIVKAIDAPISVYNIAHLYTDIAAGPLFQSP